MERVSAVLGPDLAPGVGARGVGYWCRGGPIAVGDVAGLAARRHRERAFLVAYLGEKESVEYVSELLISMQQALKRLDSFYTFTSLICVEQHKY